MCNMPDVISKGSVLRELDKVLNDKPNRGTLLAALQAQPPTPLLSLANQFNMPITDEDEKGLRENWFSNANYQWLVQPAEPILRKALITALERAMPDGLDLDCSWVCDPGHGTAGHGTAGHTAQAPATLEPLEVSISWNANQVTLILHTPHQPWPDKPSSPAPDMVIVRASPGGDPVADPVRITL